MPKSVCGTQAVILFAFCLLPTAMAQATDLAGWADRQGVGEQAESQVNEAESHGNETVFLLWQVAQETANETQRVEDAPTNAERTVSDAYWSIADIVINQYDGLERSLGHPAFQLEGLPTQFRAMPPAAPEDAFNVVPHRGAPPMPNAVLTTMEDVIPRTDDESLAGDEVGLEVPTEQDGPAAQDQGPEESVSPLPKFPSEQANRPPPSELTPESDARLVPKPWTEPTDWFWENPGAMVVASAVVALSPLAWLLGALFSRKKGPRVLENPLRELAYRLICEHPGITLDALATSMDLRRETVRHHVKVLGMEGLVSVHSLGKTRHHYVIGQGGVQSAEMHAITALSHPKRSLIAWAVLHAPGLGQGDVSRTTGLPASRVSTFIRELQDCGLIDVVTEGRHRKYFPTPVLHAQRLPMTGSQGKV